ncbi:MAG: non-canonical purine NTP pyrophosphatase, partial [Acidobacteriota bacterium]
MNPPQSLLVATRNQGKLAELRQLLADLPLVLLGLDAFPAIETIAETGSTFIENASLKACGYAAQAKLLTLADDSGLEVDALAGAPGVRSARYAGEAASDVAHIEKLLAELSNTETLEPKARFVSAIAIAGSDGSILNVSEGTCEGHIDLAPRGHNGFGYDPIFVPQGFVSTFAELETEVKN